MSSIRRAARTDAAEITHLIESAYRGESGLRGWTTETHLIGGQRTDIQEITERLHREDTVFLVLENAGELVACCMLERRENAAYFGMFAVSPARQSEGFGAQMLAHAETYAATQWKASVMIMSVIQQRSELLAWYRRKGYHPTGDTLPFPYGDPRAGLPKRDDLVFLVLEKQLSSLESTSNGA